jgi:hypothetical protein
MPHTSARQHILQALWTKQMDLQLARYLKLAKITIEGLDEWDESSSSAPHLSLEIPMITRWIHHQYHPAPPLPIHFSRCRCPLQLRC